MSAPSGLASQVVIKSESTYGVAPTVDRAIPHLSEGIELTIENIDSESIYAGSAIQKSTQRVAGNRIPAGTLSFELTDRSLGGLLLKHGLGSVNTTGSGPYTHVGTIAGGNLTNNGVTVQVGRPDTGGTVRPFTYAGGKVAKGKLEGEAGKIAKANFDMVFRQEILHRTVTDGATTNLDPTVTSVTANFTANDLFKPISGTGIPANSYIGVVTSATSIELSSTNTVHTPANATATATGLTLAVGLPLVSASYTSGILPFSTIGGSVTIDGVASCVRKWSLEWDNKLSDDRWCIGPDAPDEPLETDLRPITGTLDIEFKDMVQYNRFVTRDEFTLTLLLQAGTSSLTIAANIAYDGNAVSVGGRGLLVQSVPFRVLVPSGASDASALTFTLINGDSTP